MYPAARRQPLERSHARRRKTCRSPRRVDAAGIAPLITAGSDVRARDGWGRTPLVLAKQRGSAVMYAAPTRRQVQPSSLKITVKGRGTFCRR
jgi:hypothetical protein